MKRWAGWCGLALALSACGAKVEPDSEPATDEGELPGVDAAVESSEPMASADEPSSMSEPTESEADTDVNVAPTEMPTTAPRATATAPVEPTLPVEPTSEPLEDTTTEAIASDTQDLQTDPPDAAVDVQHSHWLYLTTPEQVLVNLDEPSQRLTSLNSLVLSQESPPWSKDGRWLTISGPAADTVTFYDLDNAGMATTVDVPGAGSFGSWLGDLGALYVASMGDEGNVIMLVTPEGQLTPLIQPNMALPQAMIGSPDGRHMMYNIYDEDGFHLFGMDISAAGEPSLATPIASSTTAPQMSFTWSTDSLWLAYGVPGGTPPISLVPAMVPLGPVPGCVAEASYTPFLAFSPNNSAFMHFGGLGESGGVLSFTPLQVTEEGGEVVALTPGEPVAIDQGAEVSPANWSSTGDYITYASGMGQGWLVAAGAELGERTELTGWGYNCPLFWTGPAQFIYQTCEADSPEVLLAELDGGFRAKALELGVVDGLSVGGACMAVRQAGQVRVGEVQSGSTPNTVPSTADALAEVVLDVQVSADGQGVLWTTGTVVHWQPLADCEPAGEEVLLDEWPGLQSLQFVPLGD